jgi:hypothetical protein
MKLAHVKFFTTAIAAIGCFVISAAITIHMIWFDTKVDAASEHFHGGAKRLEAARAFRHETYSDLPAILFLAIAALFLAILAIRFYNHAKSEFGR